MARNAIEQRNLDTVLEMYRTVFSGFDTSRLEDFFSAAYRQHSPQVADGIAGLRQFMLQAKAESPRISATVKRAFADGDYVILHVYGRRDPHDRGVIAVDIFRLEDGKIVEHWDVLQAIPSVLRHDNGLF